MNATDARRRIVFEFGGELAARVRGADGDAPADRLRRGAWRVKSRPEGVFRGKFGAMLGD